MKTGLVIATMLGSWTWLGEAQAPARLADCPAGATLSISYNAGITAPWRRFCYGAK